MAAGGRQLAIDKALFLMAFGRDADYEAMGSDLSYLDRQTGVVVWIFEIDEDAEMLAGIPADGNRGVREQVEADPDRFLEIPGLDHGDLKVYSSHGSVDQVIPVDWARLTRPFFEKLGIPCQYSEFPVGHGVAPQNFQEFMNWLEIN